MKKKIVAVSGYFTCLHEGHVRLMEEAKKLGDELVVIINNNRQQILKHGQIVHDEMSIKHTIRPYEFVDRVMISIDKDGSQCETLRELKPDIFANGGDRDENNIPEAEVCKELKIKMVSNVGGEKVNSSSEIRKRMGK